MNLQSSNSSQFLPARLRRLVGLGGASFLSSLVVGSALIGSSAALPSAFSIAQTDPNTGFTGIQVPSTSVTPAAGKVDIRFINETGAAIDYQVISDTQYRTLAGRSEMTLKGLAVPTTFTFRRADNGFLQVTLYPNSPSPGILTMRVRETADFAADRTSVYIDEAGGVFLN